MKNYTHKSRYFYGTKISDYGLKNGYIDYRTLASAFDAVLCDDLVSITAGDGYFWEPFNGDEYNEETDTYKEIYQMFVISERGAEILQELTDEIVFYNEKLNIYIWGVTHWGTSWDYVLTDIKIELDESEDGEQ